jgi:type II secretory pathway component PulF
MSPTTSQHEKEQVHSWSVWLVIWIALLISFVMGVYVIPNFRLILADMLPGVRLHWTTRIVMSVGPAVLSVLTVSGAAWVVFAGARRRIRWLESALIVALSFALAFTVVALFMPIARLLE